MTDLLVPWLAPCLLPVLLISCSVEDNQPHCKRSSDCASVEECYMGFCVLSDASTLASARSVVASEDGADAGRAANAAAADDDAAAPAACEASVECYEGPAVTRGVGTCKAGRRSCVAGLLSECKGSRLPVPETCANEGQDDDCNGVVDDVAQRGKACDTAAASGDACDQGSLRCVAEHAALQCVATPNDKPESCNGRDDDCDGKSDEGLNLQTDAAHCGSCEHACGQGQSCRAGVCVAAAGCGPGSACERGASCCGNVCVDLQTEPKHCGVCGHACQAGETCCGGGCVDTRGDPEHCGSCGVACAGQLPGCCGGACKDLAHDNDHCGRCGAACGSVLGGLLCSCRQDAGKARCEGTVLDLCL